MNSENENLSRQGKIRRENILHEALRAGRRRRRTQQSLAAITTVASIAAVVLMTWRFSLSPLPQKTIVARMGAPTTSHSRVAKPVHVSIVPTSEKDVSRYTAPRGSATVQVLNDREFLDKMREAGQPVGLAYINGKAQLLPQRPLRG